MFTGTKVALSVAIGIASLASPKYAFAENNYIDWGPLKSEELLSTQNGRGERANMNRYDSGIVYGFGSSPSQQDDLSQARKKAPNH
jgi:hypothetical protein